MFVALMAEVLEEIDPASAAVSLVDGGASLRERRDD